jgi:hypothetical protein
MPAAVVSTWLRSTPPGPAHLPGRAGADPARAGGGGARAAASDFTRVGDSAVSAALVRFEFLFPEQTGGYFDPSSDSLPLLHLWSLSVKNSLYAVAAAADVLPALPCAPGPGPGGARVASSDWPVADAGGPDAAFYQMPARFWELARGAGGRDAGRTVAGLDRVGRPGDRGGRLLPALGPFPGRGVPCRRPAPRCCSPQSTRRKQCVARQPADGLDRFDFYSLYLWQLPLLAIYRATTPGAGSLQVRLVFCAVAVALAFGPNRYVETPFRRAQAIAARCCTEPCRWRRSPSPPACSPSTSSRRRRTWRQPTFPRTGRSALHQGRIPIPRTGCNFGARHQADRRDLGRLDGARWQTLAWELAMAAARQRDQLFHGRLQAGRRLPRGRRRVLPGLNAKVLERVRKWIPW